MYLINYTLMKYKATFEWPSEGEDAFCLHVGSYSNLCQKRLKASAEFGGWS